MRPAKLGQPRHQPLQQAGGIRIGVQRPACRVGHVVLGGVTKQRYALASRMSTRQPAAERLLRGRGPIRSPRLMSSLRVNVRGHAPGSVITAYRRFSRAIASTRVAWARSLAQATRLRCEAISIPYEAMTEMTSGYGGSPLTEHPGRAHRHRHAERGQSPGEQRGRHRGPANVRRAQHENASLCLGVPPSPPECARCRLRHSSRYYRNLLFVRYPCQPAGLSATKHRAGYGHLFYLSCARRTLISHIACQATAPREFPGRCGLRGASSATCNSERK